MRKVIAAINMTVDAYCDHTAGIPDEEIHEHYTELLKSAGVILYGRITFQLMEYWRGVLKNPTGNRAMDEFAVAMDNVPKIVFSRTLKNPGWESAKLARHELREEILQLRQEKGKNIFIGSPGLIAAATKLDLIDEFQLCVHPLITGGGLRLFKNINERIALRLLGTKTFGNGAVILYYERGRR
jgi:dihydrofolate reductase